MGNFEVQTLVLWVVRKLKKYKWMDVQEKWIQQHGATCHTAKELSICLENVWPDIGVTKNTDHYVENKLQKKYEARKTLVS